MYKMMIVDDEDWVRERLIHTLDWESKGVQVIDEAANGVEALEKAKLKRPEIILTDIRMPNMDGLELIKQLKENRIQAKTIIISGYSDFDYAKKALILGAYDYILKPVEDDDLFETVERCMEQIRSERAQLALLDKADLQVNKRLPLLKEMFFWNLINDHIQNEQDVLDALADFEINNKNLNHVCFIIHVYSDEKVNPQQETRGDFVQFVIGNVVKDILDQISENDILFTNSGEMVGIVSSALPPAELSDKLLLLSDEIQKVVGRILSRSVTFGIGSVCDDMRHISLSYRQAKQFSLANGYLSKGNASGVNVPTSSIKADAYRGNDTDPLIFAIITGNKNTAIAELDQIIAQNRNMQPAELKFIFIHIVNSIVKTSLNGYKVVEDFSNYCLNILELLNKSHKVEEIHWVLADAIEKIIDFLSKTQNKRKRKAIERAVSYIEENYSQPISLHIVSDMLMLNASYFSKVFKEEMGIPFSKYLMEYRVSKAIELMSDMSLKIYEIADQVGYEDVQYFTKIFKSIKGISPMQYREKFVH